MKGAVRIDERGIMSRNLALEELVVLGGCIRAVAARLESWRNQYDNGYISLLTILFGASRIHRTKTIGN